MAYRENPKTKGSGIVCAIPQTGACPNDCDDCFFQSGRSYLEPLDSNLPNVPEGVEPWQVVRINDGNDSNVDRRRVIAWAKKNAKMFFFNTAIPKELGSFPGPVVLTVNPGKMTDTDFYKIDPIPVNLMFVRVRTNTWNISNVAGPAVAYYSCRSTPVVLTFMAYYGTSDTIPEAHRQGYIYRKRTLNDYHAITTKAWEGIMRRYKHNKWVHSCGKIEGERGTTSCRHCGSCLREYFATMQRMHCGE